MQTRPMTSVRGESTLTRFDPIRNTPGTPDYVNSAGEINGQARNSVIGRGGLRTYGAGPLERFAEPWAVPSLPRRNYIPTVSRVELD